MSKKQTKKIQMKKESVFSIRDDKKFRIAFLAVFLLVLIAMAYIFRYYFWPALFAVVFYIALKPFHDYLYRQVKRRWLSSTITVLLFVLLVVIPLLFLLMALADQTYQFYLVVAEKFDPKALQALIYSDDRLRIILERLNIGQGELLLKIVAVLQNISLSIFSNITDMVGFSLKFMVNFFFMILILFSIFVEGPRLGELMYRIIPFPRDIEQSIFKRLRDVIKVLVAGNLAIMLMQGISVSAGFFIFGSGMPLLAGCFAALFSLIPMVGTSFIWIPAAIYFLLSGLYVKALMISIWCLFWYLFLENWVKPKFFGGKLNFHPMVFFFLLIGSLGAFNLPGIIIGPVLLTLFYALWEIYTILYIEAASKSDVTKTASGR